MTDQIRRTGARSAFLVYVLRRFQYDRAFYTAGSLSYASLLSLVPLMAIGLAMLAAFPGFEEVRSRLLNWVIANFVPAISSVVHYEFMRFIANAGRLSAAGIIGLVLTAVMLLGTIETAMNHVFRVARHRSLLSRLVVYWSLLTLGPLLIGTSVSLQGYLSASARLHLARFALERLAAPLPILLSTIAFIILFMLMPNRRVLAKDAVRGGLVAGILFAMLRGLFGLYVARSSVYASVYGALAAIPIVLVWTYLSWVVVLIGAEITAALPEWRGGYRLTARNPSGPRRLTLALAMLAALREAQIRGAALSRRDLSARLPAAESDIVGVLRHLTATHLVAPTSQRRYLLARDPALVTLADLVAALDLNLDLDPAIAAAAPWRAAVASRLDAFRRRGADILAVPLAALLSPPDGPEAESGQPTRSQ
jgi:membrane protein